MMNVPSKHFSKKRKRKRELSFNMTRYLLLLGILFRFYSVECVIISQAQLEVGSKVRITRREGEKREKKEGVDIFIELRIDDDELPTINPGGRRRGP